VAATPKETKGLLVGHGMMRLSGAGFTAAKSAAAEPLVR